METKTDRRAQPRTQRDPPVQLLPPERAAANVAPKYAAPCANVRDFFREVLARCLARVPS
eukprot:8923313-Lingulodinium_polyedra.AAC.1